MVLNAILDPIFSPLLALPTIVAILLVSALISFVIVIVYKYMTDQDLMKRLKDEIKELQSEMKTLRDNPEKMLAVQKRAMETNMKYMMHSLKPTLVTFIPIILIFGWLNAHFAYQPIIAGQDFSVTLQFEEGFSGNVSLASPSGLSIIDDGLTRQIFENKASWVLRGTEPGSYPLNFTYNSKSYAHTVLLVSDGSDKSYIHPIVTFNDEILQSITVSNKKLTPLGNFSIFGWRPGWLAWYIILSIVFSLVFRRVLKVY